MRTFYLFLAAISTAVLSYGLGHIEGKREGTAQRTIVTDMCSQTMMLTDTDAGAQTVTRLDYKLTGLYFDWVGLIPAFRPDAQNVLMLGLGGGEMFRVLRANGYKGKLTGVDSSSDTSDVARTFGLNQLGVDVVNGDALWFVSVGMGSDARYEGVIVDLYQGKNMSPEQANMKLYRNIAALMLAPRGVVLVNVAWKADVARVAAAMREGGLLDVYAFPVQGQSNTMLLGMVKDDWGEVTFSGELLESAAHHFTP